MGLQRAAQIAGAHTVVATLWGVNDRDAQALMERFYLNLWKKGMPKLEALREAQLALLRGDMARGPGALKSHPEDKPFRTPPSAWAAWVLSGDWR